MHWLILGGVGTVYLGLLCWIARFFAQRTAGCRVGQWIAIACIVVFFTLSLIPFTSGVVDVPALYYRATLFFAALFPLAMTLLIAATWKKPLWAIFAGVAVTPISLLMSLFAGCGLAGVCF